ncbi:O-antigen ligase family protein [Priestia megaterium]|uniref:O-antigen ligase family protein n=1 Tax=Priestia megaterium TaxID=1404 RepID=UPI003A874C51
MLKDVVIKKSSFSYITFLFFCSIALIPFSEVKFSGIPLANFFFLIYGISFIMLIKNKKLIYVAQLLMRERFLLLLFLSLLLSFCWSIDTHATLYNIMTLFGTLVFSTYIVATKEYEDFLKLLLVYFFIFCVINLLYVLSGAGGIETETNIGAWKGLTGQKNRFGFILSIGFIVALIVLISQRKLKVLSIATLTLTAFLMIKSESSTALIVTTIAVILIFSSKLLKLHPYLLFALISFSVTLLIGFLNFFESPAEIVSGTTGKDLTFTGRTDIWIVILNFIKESHYLGYGYNAFWSSPIMTSRFVSSIGFETISAHNGYLEVFLGLGFIGFSVFLFGLLKYLRLSLNLIKKAPGNKSYLFLLAFLVFLIINNFTESLFLLPNHLLSILLFSTCLYLYKLHHPEITKKKTVSH